MNVDFDVDLFFSLFDLVIFGLVIWGAYAGYSKGAIVQAISLFALFAGLAISVLVTKLTYSFFIRLESRAPDLFASIVLAFFFIAAIWASNYIRQIVQKNVSELTKGTYNRIIGVGLGMVKFFIIVSVFVLVVYKLDIYGKFLPPSEKGSKLGKLGSNSLMKVFKFLRMDMHDMQDTIFILPDSVDIKKIDDMLNDAQEFNNDF